MNLKIQSLFRPFVAVLTGFVVLYSFIDWLIFIKLHLFQPREEMVFLLFPFVLSWIPVVIWLRSSLKLIDYSNTRRASPFGYILLATICITLSTFTAQKYLSTAAGELTADINISGISKYHWSKFYMVKDYYVDKERGGHYYVRSVTGKQSRSYNIDLYFAFPICSARDTFANSGLTAGNRYNEEALSQSTAESNTLKNKTTGLTLADSTSTLHLDVNSQSQLPFAYAWCCLHYHDQMSNSASSEEKEARKQALYQQGWNEIQNTNFGYVFYFEHIGNNLSQSSYFNAIAHSRRTLFEGKPILLEPKFKPFDERNGDWLMWLLIAFAGSLLFWLLVVVASPLKAQRDEGKKEEKV